MVSRKDDVEWRPGADNATRIVTNLIYSRDPILILCRWILVGVLVVSALRSLSGGIVSLDPDLTTRKDFLQDYLMGKAVANGINPYLPTSVLSERFQGKLRHPVFPHPCPHPPFVAVLLVPLSLFEYQTAATIWFVLEVCIIILVMAQLSEYLDGEQKFLKRAILCLTVFAWYPFGQELIFGQLSALLLLAVVLMWRFLRQDREILGGVVLGLSLSIKLFTWPFLVFYLFRRRWLVVSAAILSSSLVNLVAAWLLGFRQFRYYFLEVSAQVFDSYRSYEWNWSLWTVGWRIFEGTGSRVLKGVEAGPLYYAPELAGISSGLLVAAVVVAGTGLALRTRNVDISFGLMICMAVLISPVAWSHYLMLAAVPLAIAARQSLIERLSGKASMLLLFSGILLFIPYSGIRPLLFASNLQNDQVRMVPFILTLPAFLPAVGLSLLMVVLWQLDQERPMSVPAAQNLSDPPRLGGPVI